MKVNLTEAKIAATKLAPKLKGGEVLALIGPLGSGKTTFTKALAKALKITTRVHSPSFSLMDIHKAVLKNGRKIYFYHLDLYRTKSFKEIKALGLTEHWGKANNVVVIEWANKISRYLPKKTRKIQFYHAL